MKKLFFQLLLCIISIEYCIEILVSTFTWSSLVTGEKVRIKKASGIEFTVFWLVACMVLKGIGDCAKTFSAEEHVKIFYVSNLGNDRWSGSIDVPNSTTTDGPLATLQRARDLAREFRSTRNEPATVIIEVLDGCYELDEPLTLDARDGGVSENCPTIWRARNDGKVTINAGRYAKNIAKATETNFELPTQIQPQICEKLLCLDLSDLGIDSLGTPVSGSTLFFQGKPMTLARYPNEGFIKVTGLSDKDVHEVDIRGTKGIVEGKIKYDDLEVERSLGEKDLWAHGYWFWDWSEQKQSVESIDAAEKLIVLRGPHHSYGYRVGQWFYLFNSLVELDQPGEYYIDRDSYRLYFYPTTDSWNQDDFLLTYAPHILQINGASHLEWSGFRLIGSQETAVTGNNLDNVTIKNCDIFDVGGSGIALQGRRLAIEQCELWYLGASGVRVSGGNRVTLEGSGNRVVNNYIHDYALFKRVYEPGIQIDGVGNYAAHNVIENAPHMGIGFGGNDNLLEYNEISNVCTESNDAGAVYTGRNWTMRGNVLRYNYLHDIQGLDNRGCVGIYLDDMFSSAEMLNNLFVRVTRAAFIGGGRDSKINGNVFVDCFPALHIDARGVGWAKDHVNGWIKEDEEKGTLSGIAYNKPPYSTKYPKLARILDNKERAGLPEGNEVCGNVCVGGTWDVNNQGQWQGASVEKIARPLLLMDGNSVVPHEVDNLFIDEANGDYRFNPECERVKPNFPSLPLDRIGVEGARMKSKVDAWRSGN